MSHPRAWLPLVTAFGLAMGLAGCSANRAGQDSQPRQTLTIKGSDTMVQLAQAWAQEFMKQHPGVEVTVTGGGSNTGISALMSKGTDIANASRSMKEGERKLAATNGVDVKEFVVAQDALSIIVHPENPISSFTLEDLKRLYTGEVKNWKELGGPDQRVVLNSRETSSGTYVFFQEHVLGKGVPFADTAMLQPSTSQIVQNVATDKGAIGYVGLGSVNSTVKSVPIRKDAASPAISGTVENVLNSSYPLARPLFEYTAGEPTGIVKTWLDWIVGPEGQAIVKQLDFVPAK